MRKRKKRTKLTSRSNFTKEGMEQIYGGKEEKARKGNWCGDLGIR